MVWQKGSFKYEYNSPDNVLAWNKPMDWSRVLGSTERHLGEWLEGERYDEETGCHHLAQVAWNVLVLMTYELLGLGKDDLRRDINKLTPWRE